MKTAALLMLLLTAAPAGAQPIERFDTYMAEHLAWKPDNRGAADKLSTGLVVTALALPCLVNQANRTWRCALHEGGRVGVAISLAELAKHFVHRPRPDGSDDKSFFSEHTAITCAAVAGSDYWALCPAVGYLRVAANKHWTTDVALGSVFIAVRW